MGLVRSSFSQGTSFFRFESTWKFLQWLWNPNAKAVSEVAMPKNKGKGGKAHRRGKGDQQLAKRELRLRDADCELYGQVLKMLGNARL